MLALVDPEIASDRERLERAAALFRPEYTSRFERLSAMMSDSSEALAGLAAHHVAELGVRGEAAELGGAMEAAARRGRWSDALDNAVRLLRGKAEVPSAG